MILALAFKSNISEEVAKRLEVDHFIAIPSSVGGIEAAAQEISMLKPDKVIALGSYSGRDQDRCRLEQFCSSRFRNNGDSTKIKLNSWVDGADLKLASGMGNSWCNKLSYEIACKYPELMYSFVHVPKEFDLQEAVKAIDYSIKTSELL